MTAGVGAGHCGRTDAPRDSMTVFDELRDLAQHIDPQFHPTLNELPALFAALVAQARYGDELGKAVEAGQEAQRDLHPSQVAGSEVRASVGELIQPERGSDQPVQGVPQQHYDALKSEVESLRAQFERLVTKTAPSEDAPTEPPVAPPASTDPAAPADAGPSREAELQAEIDQLRYEAAQRSALDTAHGEHPTADSEPLPADPAAPAPPAEGPA